MRIYPQAQRFPALDYLIFGDSITETATVDNSGNYTEGTRSNWPKFAMPMLHAKRWFNYAESGASYREYVGIGDFQKISHQINRADIDGREPDIVIISCGTNDGNNPPTYGSAATAMGKAALGDLDLTLTMEAARWAFWSIRTNWPNLTACYCVQPTQKAATDPSALSALYDGLTILANRYNFIVIDATAESGIVRDFETVGVAGRDLSDGLHPNLSGQQKIANLIAAKVKSSIFF